MPKFCDSCGASLGEAKRFCPECGAPIPGRERSGDGGDGRPRRACARCGAELDEDALYCEQCGQRTAAAADPSTLETARWIEQKFNLLWLIPLLLCAIALFAIPDSLKNAGVPDILKSPWAWAALLLASVAISFAFYWVVRRALKALRSSDPSIGGTDPLPPGAAASASAASGMGATLALSLLAALVLLAANLLGLGGGGSAPVPGPDPNPSAVPSAGAADGVSPAPEDTQAPEKKEQTLEGVWMPVDATVAAEGISGPNMVTEIPSILFQDGCMFMGYGDNASDIYYDSCVQNSYISGYYGFPFTLSDGVITVETPYDSSANQTWTIGTDLYIYTGMGTFMPMSGANIVDKAG